MGVRDFDAGKYKCVAKNSIGTDDDEAQATVYEKTALFRKPPENVFIVLEKPLELPCEATADARLTNFLKYKWLKDNAPLRYNNRVKWLADKNVLRISKTILTDRAQYKCFAYIDAPQQSEDSDSTIADIKGVPFQPTDLTITNCIQGTTVITWKKGKDNDFPTTKFIVEQESTYFPEEWMVIANISDPSKRQHKLKLTLWADLRFRMRAVNKIGPSRASAPTPKGKCITAQGLPSTFPKNLRGIPGKANELDIAWKAMTKLEANAPGFHYILYYAKADADLFLTPIIIKDPSIDRFKVPNAGYNVKWKFQIVAKNILGRGPISDIKGTFSGPNAPAAPKVIPPVIVQFAEYITGKVALDKPNDVTRSGFELVCEASGSSPMKVTWKHNNKDIVALRGISLKKDPSKPNQEILSVTELGASPADDGKYQCFVSNAAGGTFSAKLYLKVTDGNKFQKFEDEMELLNVTVGKQLRLACPPKAGSYPGFGEDHLWGRRKGRVFKTLQPDKHRALLPNGDYLFLHLKQSDIDEIKNNFPDGTVQCVVTAGNAIYGSHQFLLKVTKTENTKFGPSFAKTDYPTSREGAAEGERKKLFCAAVGNPAPNITWYRLKNDKTVLKKIVNGKDGFRLKDFGRELTIDVVSKAQHKDGYYRCTASNGVGPDINSPPTKLEVDVAPNWTRKPPNEFSITIGSNNSLRCEAVGNPPPSFKWYYNGTTFTSDKQLAPNIIVDGKFLRFNNMQKSNEGVFQCAVENKEGSLVSSTWVKATTGSQQRCEKLTISLCNNFGYNYTAVPNFLNHRTQDEAELEMYGFTPLLTAKCSRYIQLFLCSMYAPTCAPIGFIPPCRSICEEAREGCRPFMSKFGLNWPASWSCSQFHNRRKGPCVTRPHGRNDITTPSTPTVTLQPSMSTPAVSSCGQTPYNVANGNNASPHSWPWHVSLRFNGRHMCSASLIKPNWVVTAAHCVSMSFGTLRYSVVVGAHNKRFGTTAVQRTFRVKKMFKHEGFSDRLLTNDIALLQLSGSVQTSSKVNTVCLPKKGAQAPTGKDCYVTGWGRTATTLQQAKFPVASHSSCSRANGRSISVDRRSMICAGGLGKGVCHGDSGGPLVCKEGSRWVLRGAVSWGYSNCRSGGYTVFARVGYFIDWINKKMS